MLMAATAAISAFPSFAANSRSQLDVFKSAACGCCGAWVDHLKAADFRVKVIEVEDPSAVRKRHGLPERFGSCHTAMVDGYVIEGHVPAADVARLLASKPLAIGLAVPEMPVGSPGMELGDRKDGYEVLLIDKSGRPTVFFHYPKL